MEGAVAPITPEGDPTGVGRGPSDQGGRVSDGGGVEPPSKKEKTTPDEAASGSHGPIDATQALEASRKTPSGK